MHPDIETFLDTQRRCLCCLTQRDHRGRTRLCRACFHGTAAKHNTTLCTVHDRRIDPREVQP